MKHTDIRSIQDNDTIFRDETQGFMKGIANNEMKKARYAFKIVQKNIQRIASRVHPEVFDTT
jgi:hypothetical protein